MQKIYCLNCGSPTEYSLTIPIFCSKCGKNLNDLGISLAEVTIPSYTNKSKISLNRHISVKDETNENTEIPNIEKLEIEPILPENRGIKLGVVAKQGKTGFSRPKAKKMTIKQVEEVFKKEAIGTAKLIEIGGGEEE